MSTTSQLKPPSVLSRWTLITTDSGNPIFTTFTHIDPHFISLPLSTSQDVIYNAFSQGITSITAGQHPPLVIEQFGPLTFATCSNPKVDCCLNTQEFLRYYLHILYHLIEFRFGPSFFSILKAKKRFRTKSYLPILTRLNSTLNTLLDSHPPTLIGSLQRVELKPTLLSQCRKEIFRSLIIANAKSLDPSPFPFYNDFEPISQGAENQLPGFLSHGLLFIRDALVAVVGTFERTKHTTPTSPQTTSKMPLPKSRLLKKSATIGTVSELPESSSSNSVPVNTPLPTPNSTPSTPSPTNKISMQLPAALDGYQVMNLLIILKSLFTSSDSTLLPNSLSELPQAQVSENTLFFLEPLFLDCIDSVKRHTYCYFRSLGPETRLILVCRPITPIPKAKSKSKSANSKKNPTPTPPKTYKSLVDTTEVGKLSKADTQNLLTLIKARCHRTASLVENRLKPFIDFVTLTATQQLDMIYKHYIGAQPIPGLLYFCFAERSRYHTTCPAIAPFESLSTSLSAAQLLTHVWRLFGYSFKAASIGQTTCLIRRGEFIYSYSLWVESPPQDNERTGVAQTLPRTPGVLSPWTPQSKYPPRPQTWHSTALSSSHENSTSPFSNFQVNNSKQKGSKKRSADPTLDEIFAEYDPSLPESDPDYPFHPLEYESNIPNDSPSTLSPINVDWALPFWFPENNQSLDSSGNRLFQLFTLYKPPKRVDFSSIVTLDQLLLEILRGKFPSV